MPPKPTLAPAASARARGAFAGLPGRAGQRDRVFAYARICWPEGTSAEQELVALHLAAILALDDVLETEPPSRSIVEAYQTLLPWHAPMDEDGDCGSDVCSRVRFALKQVEITLGAIVAQRTVSQSKPGCHCTRQSAMQWWRTEAEQMVWAAWQESHWRHGTRPDEATYLAVAELSIAVRWIATTLIVLAGASTAPPAGAPELVAVHVASAAIRLANDLHDTRRERREGKLQLPLLRTELLRAQGYSATYADRRARREVRALLAAKVTRAREVLDPLNWSGSVSVRLGVASMLDAALALIKVPELTVPGAAASEGHSTWTLAAAP